MNTENSLIINDDLAIPFDTITFTYVRSSGPGGQNVNKVASKAVLRWNLIASVLPDDAKARFQKRYPSYIAENGDVVITAQKYRDAPKNRDNCLEKLQNMLENALKKPKKRIPTKPTFSSIRRRLDNKAKASEKKALRRPIRDSE